MKHPKLTSAVILLTLLLASSSVTLATTHKNAVEFLIGQGNFTTLVDLVVQAGLDEVLATGGPFTIFAPNDEAFADLAANSPDIFNAVASDPELLTQVLLYHVVDGSHLAHQLTSYSTVATLNGAPVLVYRSHRNVYVNDSWAERLNYRASNAVIMEMNSVLIPPAEGTEINNVMDVLRFDSRFSTLVAVLEQTGLDEALENAAGVTVYAPTDDAFAALQASDPDLFNAVVSDTDLLTAVLLYHVSPVPREASLLLIQKMVPTLHGGFVMAQSGMGEIMVNDAPINSPDISTSNGFVHALDAVLVPPAQ